MEFDKIRRELLALLGGMAATWPFAGRAQQPTMPVIGFLSSLTAGDQPRIMAAFSKGLSEAGYSEGRNVAIEYHFAEGQFDRLPAMAANLARRRVAVIAAISGTPSALAAKAATTTIPIVFAMGSDPIVFGLVASLSQPGGNVTGATFFTVSLGAKRLRLLRELVPKAKTIAVLTNPNNPVQVTDRSDVEAAARAMGLQFHVFDGSTRSQIDASFATLAHERPDALYVSPDVVFFNDRDYVAALATRLVVPAIFGDREMAEAGGLMSYGASRADAYRQAGNYAGRILKGERPGDLPIVLPTKFEFVINLKTAKALGVKFSDNLLSLADEVIE